MRKHTLATRRTQSGPRLSAGAPAGDANRGIECRRRPPVLPVRPVTPSRHPARRALHAGSARHAGSAAASTARPLRAARLISRPIPGFPVPQFPAPRSPVPRSPSPAPPKPQSRTRPEGPPIRDPLAFKRPQDPIRKHALATRHAQSGPGSPLALRPGMRSAGSNANPGEPRDRFRTPEILRSRAPPIQDRTRVVGTAAMPCLPSAILALMRRARPPEARREDIHASGTGAERARDRLR